MATQTKARRRRQTAATRIKMVVQSPSDRNQAVMIPYAVSWAAARGIARDTHYAVILYGTWGTAHFRQDGTGYVEWKEADASRMKTTEFDHNATVSI